VSNHLATMLIKLSPFQSREDDIAQLYTRLRDRTTNPELKTFLVRSYRRFEAAAALRNRCAHVLQGEPTKQEIEQSIQLARLLQKYMPRP
jgi:transcriptional regulator of acetoin/glycerol metabolism